MPAAPAPEELKEKVKAVALQIGVREAARQFGLDEERVLKWSARGKWFETKALVAEAVGNYQVKQQVSSAVLIDPAKVLLSVGNKSKLMLAKTVHKTAKQLHKAKDKELVLQTQALKATVDAGAKLHGWDTPSPSLTQINVNLGSTDLRDSPK